MTDTATNYAAQPPRVRLRGIYREPLDAKVGRMLGISQDRAKRLRVVEIGRAIAAILLAGRDDPAKREAFRRQVEEASQLVEVPALTSDLELAAARADAEEDIAEAAHVRHPTDENRRARAKALRREIALQTEVLRGLEA